MTIALYQSFLRMHRTVKNSILFHIKLCDCQMLMPRKGTTSQLEQYMGNTLNGDETPKCMARGLLIGEFPGMGFYIMLFL